MTDQAPQSRENHARFVPLWHYVAWPILLGLFVWAVVRLVGNPSADTVGDVLLLFALLIVAIFTRSFALRAQDRVIRLEEQLRFQRLFPAALLVRMDEFTPPQYIALRFASDAELPDLARKVLDEKITDQKAIKSLIVTWRPDHMRV
ncbi:MAG: DUF6526 family protein [Gemmatimonadales bacterium]